MSDSDSSSWPDDEDPFSSIDENSSEENDVAPSNHQEDETYEESGESIEEIEETVTSNENMEVAQWSLPIRAAPIMALAGDDVQEFPLVETPDGLTSTSLVINEKLIRIEKTYLQSKAEEFEGCLSRRASAPLSRTHSLSMIYSD